MSKYARPDYWAQKAQREGYPARSVYKLEELNTRFGLFPPRGPLRVLDLGAAPGSWSLYALRTLGSRCLLSCCDLVPFSRACDKGLFDGENVHFVQGDLTTSAVRDLLAPCGPFDIVLSDAAPATTGSRAVDTARSLALAQAALDWAAQCLVPGGRLVAKVFQSEDTAALLNQFRAAFESAHTFKPKVCRANSFETYLVGLGRKRA